MYQPFYVGGIENLQTAKDSAFGSMILFVITFVVSIILWFRDSRIKKRQVILARQHSHTYDQVMTTDEFEQQQQQQQPYEASIGELPSSVVERAASLSRRTSSGGSANGGFLQDDTVVEEEELESSHPHVPEGQLLPTTHV